MDVSLQILLFIALIILVAKAAGGLSARLGLPTVLGELLAGVILGPTVLNIWRFPWFSSPAPLNGSDAVSLAAVLKVLAQLGIAILMFLAGLETDIEMMKKTLRPAFWSACGGVIFPLAGGSWLARELGFTWREAVFIGSILTATSVSTTTQTLVSLNKLRSKVGSTILGAAVIDDVLGLVVLSLVIAAESHNAQRGGWLRIGKTGAHMVVFLVLAFWWGPRLIRFVLRQTRHFHGPHTGLAAALAIAFLFAFFADFAGGLAAITGAYLAGLFMAAAPAHADVIPDLRSMTNSLFGPLFFAAIGLEVNARTLSGHFGLFFLVLLVAVLGKVLGCGLGARLNGFTGRDSLVVGVGMIPRGEVELIAASIGSAAGVVSPAVYSLIVVLVLTTNLMTPLLLAYCHTGKELVPGMLPTAPSLGAGPDA